MYTFHSRVFLIFEKNYFSKTEEMVKRTFMHARGGRSSEKVLSHELGSELWRLLIGQAGNPFLEKGSVCVLAKTM